MNFVEKIHSTHFLFLNAVKNAENISHHFCASIVCITQIMIKIREI